MTEVGSARPWLSNPAFSVRWSGRGTEGMMFWMPASLGIEVPEGAISESEPPWWGSVILFLYSFVVLVKRALVVWQKCYSMYSV